jgi:hypothetical protein
VTILTNPLPHPNTPVKEILDGIFDMGRDPFQLVILIILIIDFLKIYEKKSLK